MAHNLSLAQGTNWTWEFVWILRRLNFIFLFYFILLYNTVLVLPYFISKGTILFIVHDPGEDLLLLDVLLLCPSVVLSFSENLRVYHTWTLLCCKCSLIHSANQAFNTIWVSDVSLSQSSADGRVNGSLTTSSI